MAYSADSFVADEQPTTAKWNKLWNNDASFNDGSGLNNIQNAITANSSNHLQLVAGTNKLVKLTALRQDNTTNAYKTNAVLLYGWGFILGTSDRHASETVTFGITFDAAPTVVASAAGARVGSDPSAVSDLNSPSSGDLDAVTCDASQPTTTTFVAEIANANNNLNNTVRYGYAWHAIGELT